MVSIALTLPDKRLHILSDGICERSTTFSNRIHTND